MNVLILLPHRDVTLRPRAPDGFALHDASAAFWAKAAGARGLGAVLERWRAEPFDPERARTLLAGSVAEALFSRGPDLHERLWAVGAALEAIGSEHPHLRLRLDDLELSNGSTERLDDVARAAEHAGPWEEALEEALAVAEGAERVALWLDRDQQLPCVEAFARRLPQPERLELWGPFAAEHAEGLRKLPGLGRARVADAVCPVEVTAPPGHPERAALAWREEGAPVPEAPWAGRVRLDELPGLADTGAARAVSFAFCAVTTDEVLGVDGLQHPRAAVELALADLGNAGVRVLAEWWVGAPGVSERAHLESAQALAKAAWPLAGLRAFHWTRGRPADVFNGARVRLLPVEEERALFRTHPFEAQGTVAPERLHEVLQACLSTLGRLPFRVPGRIAAAYAFAPERPDGQGLCFAPGAAVVTLPFKLDGQPGPAHYAASLATGTVLSMDPRLATALATLQRPLSAETLFATFPAEKRAAAARALVDRRILREGTQE